MVVKVFSSIPLFILPQGSKLHIMWDKEAWNYLSLKQKKNIGQTMWKAINYQANCFPSWPRHPLLNFFITQQTLWFIHGRLVGGNSIHKTSSLDSGQCILCHKSLAHPIRDNENKIEAVQRDSSLDMAMTRPVREGRSKKSRKSKGTNSRFARKWIPPHGRKPDDFCTGAHSVSTPEGHAVIH